MSTATCVNPDWPQLSNKKVSVNKHSKGGSSALSLFCITFNLFVYVLYGNASGHLASLYSQPNQNGSHMTGCQIKNARNVYDLYCLHVNVVPHV